MDYEKAYNEALQRAKSIYRDAKSEHCTHTDWLENIFPELKESDDERIRKEIISYIKSSGAVTNPNWIAWLEKQGSQNLANSEKTCKDEQKPQPKFKVGDYVKDVNFHPFRVYQIMHIDNECYICQYTGKEQLGDKSVRHIAFEYPYLRLTTKPDELTHGEQNPVWGEEDEISIDEIIETLNIVQANRLRTQRTHYSKATIDKDIAFLKSLKERYTWKPSVEQMYALQHIIACYHGDYEHLADSLYNDLNKLKG